MDYITAIAAVSVAINASYVWASYRRKEIVALVRRTMEFYRDDSKTVEELWEVMDDLDAVLEKK